VPHNIQGRVGLRMKPGAGALGAVRALLVESEGGLGTWWHREEIGGGGVGSEREIGRRGKMVAWKSGRGISFWWENTRVTGASDECGGPGVFDPARRRPTTPEGITNLGPPSAVDVC
jgi:hypothetical protein